MPTVRKYLGVDCKSHECKCLYRKSQMQYYRELPTWSWHVKSRVQSINETYPFEKGPGLAKAECLSCQ